MAGRKRGRKKRRGRTVVSSRRPGKPRLKRGSQPFNVKTVQALTKLQRNQKLAFKDLKEEIAFENISRIAIGSQAGRIGEKEWNLVRNVLLRNQYKV